MDRQELIERIYEEHQQLMYNTAYAILKDTYLAEDTVHECVLRLYKAKAFQFTVESVTSPTARGLVRIVARNEACRMYHRHIEKAFCTVPIEDDLLFTSMDFTAEIEIKDFMDRLDPGYRDIVVLRLYYGYSYSQIGRLLGIMPQTARNRMVQAKKLLRSRWIGGDALGEEQTESR